MTSVDFKADRLDAPGESIYLGNSLSGPATAALFRLTDVIEAGEVDGHTEAGLASAELTGRQLRALLAGLGDDSGRGFVERRGHTDEASLQAAIDDDGVYGVTAFES